MLYLVWSVMCHFAVASSPQHISQQYTNNCVAYPYHHFSLSPTLLRLFPIKLLSLCYYIESKLKLSKLYLLLSHQLANIPKLIRIHYAIFKIIKGVGGCSNYKHPQKGHLCDKQSIITIVLLTNLKPWSNDAISNIFLSLRMS